ncbi:MAG: DinB family protein [Ignavibacteria bacterium]
MKDLLTNYTKYNLWANTKVCGFLEKLEPALLDKELVSSFDTIRKTVYHIWDAETIWFKRLNGESLREWPSESYKGTDTDFIKPFLEQSKKFTEYVGPKHNEELLVDCEFSTLKGDKFVIKICNILLHCMNHSTYHRGQITTMLRSVGFTELSSTDYLAYVIEHVK